MKNHGDWTARITAFSLSDTRTKKIEGLTSLLLFSKLLDASIKNTDIFDSFAAHWSSNAITKAYGHTSDYNRSDNHHNCQSWRCHWSSSHSTNHRISPNRLYEGD